MKPLTFPAALLAILTTFTNTQDASANDGPMCQRRIDTVFADPLIEGCQPGDVLVAQIAPNVGPAATVGRFCDLNFSVWSETRINGQVTVVCVYHDDRGSGLVDRR